jgi:hypothetical protein
VIVCRAHRENDLRPGIPDAFQFLPPHSSTRPLGELGGHLRVLALLTAVVGLGILQDEW